MDKSDYQELLVTLYLRLNGYFTSGFIVHAPEQNKTEIDILAVRFPYNAEPEREIPPSEYLLISPDHIDILICEVKGGKKVRAQFNKALRLNPLSIQSVLRWVGVFRQDEIGNLIEPLQAELAPQKTENPNQFKGIIGPRQTSIRCVFFAVDRKVPTRNQPRYIHGQEIIDHIWQCLCPQLERPMCATRYDFGLWGVSMPIVTYFKDRSENGQDQGTMQDFYDHFGFV